jgi:hypothetical protein
MKTGWTKIVVKLDPNAPWAGDMFLRMGAKGKGKVLARTIFSNRLPSIGFTKMRLVLVEKAHARGLLVMGVD